jgi:membrane protein
MTPDRLWTVIKTALAGWWNDNVPHMGAALAYYTLFALAPILIVVVAVGGMVFGPEAVRGEIVGQIGGLVGRDGALAIQSDVPPAASPILGRQSGRG